jgi:acetylornithine deacetylase/succinyl-diaminopimelate desuccinylase-like protein
LYGRGSADDGYAVYASITALQALKRQGLSHPRIVGLIETSEESGSPDLLPTINALGDRLGAVELVICLDSGAGNYDQLWLTTSLRGMATGVLEVEILTEGVHSGDASGLVPSSFRILRHVLDRLEDRRHWALASFPILLRDSPNPDCAGRGGRSAAGRFDLQTLSLGPSQLRGLRSCFVANDDGSDGGSIAQDLDAGAERHRCGRVSGPRRCWKCAQTLHSFQAEFALAPLVDAAKAVQDLKNLLEDNAPYQARVTFHIDGASSGWNAPETVPGLRPRSMRPVLRNLARPSGT